VLKHRPFKLWFAVIVGAGVMVSTLAQSEDTQVAELHAYDANGDYEPAVLSIIESIELGDLDLALSKVDAHLKAFPKSRIGHLLRADILQGMSGQLTEVGASSGLPANRIDGLVHQVRLRWKHAKDEAVSGHSLFPSTLVYMGKHRYAIVADMPEGRLYLYKNNDGSPELVRDYYMTVGSAGYGKQVEGDNKTPVGVYEVNKYIEGKALPDLYGKGAFPVNYPNRYDRFLDRSGYGIWLHGTPSDTYARSPWSSEGCFVLSNDDLLDISQYISAKDRTPVILSDTIEWLEKDQLDLRRQAFLKVIEQWQQDWESLDTEAFVKHYQQTDFNFGEGRYEQWRKRKVLVNQGKTFVQLGIDIDSLFAYPGEEDMFVVKYKQHYLSNNFASESEKTQYWKRTRDGSWKVLYEG